MRYLGNKTRLLKKLDKFINDNNITGEVFCDLFSGTSSVGDFFKNKYKIIANDFLSCSYQIAMGKLLNYDKPLFLKFYKKFNTNPFDYFDNKLHEYKNHYFITNNYSPKGNRMFFSEQNAIKIDSIRIEVEELYKERVFSENEYYYLLSSLLESSMKHSNTTGTYEAFLKKWDSRALKKLKFQPLEMYHCQKGNPKNEVYNEDANSLIRKIKGDILYIDPPYTTTEYSSAYHVLESIARYDYPEISGITGRRKDNDRKSAYTRKTSALNSFEDLIRQADFSHIIISYSNQSIIPLSELEEMLSKYSIDRKVIKKITPYREYKNIRSSKKAAELFEILLYIKKDNNFIKSPLNYSGSKDNLMPQIHKYLPGHISTFVDAMGGAFNVGINVVAEKVIYNEYNPFVYELVYTLLNINSKKIIEHVEMQIKNYKLQKSNSKNYNVFRKKYNDNQEPLDLFVLTMFCFQNQIRFNNFFKFNTPVGNCAYNETTKNRILNFIPKAKKIICMNKNFSDIDLSKFDRDTLFYFDPPYFITNATYNDGKRGFNGWDADLETILLGFLTTLNESGYKFMLSNVIYHKGKTNHLLLEWADSNGFKISELSHSVRKEVLITNYELDGGKR